MATQILHFLLICLAVSAVTGALRKEEAKEIAFEILRAFLVLTVGILLFALFLFFMHNPDALF